MRLQPSDAGAVVTETVLLIPVFGVLMLLVVFVGRITNADLDVEAAARDAARAASIANSAAQAQSAALASATAALEGDRIRCTHLGVDVDTSRFSAGGSVAVTISCAVALTDVAGIKLPGSKTLSARAIEVVDRYRGGLE